MRIKADSAGMSAARHAEVAGYKAIAWKLISDAAGDYHGFHHSELRRALIVPHLGSKRGAVRANAIARWEARLRERASVAERWIAGAEARFPFWLAAAWMGWEADTLAGRIRDARTGWNLLVAEARRKGYLGEPAKAVAEFLRSK